MSVERNIFLILGQLWVGGQLSCQDGIFWKQKFQVYGQKHLVPPNYNLKSKDFDDLFRKMFHKIGKFGTAGLKKEPVLEYSQQVKERERESERENLDLRNTVLVAI